MEQEAITVRLNGEFVQVENGVTITALLAVRGIDPETVVVERNRAIIEKQCYGVVRLEPDDEIEILRFVGGG